MSDGGRNEHALRELREAGEEITRLRDLLTDLWNFESGRAGPMTARSQLLWAKVEAVVHEGQFGWGEADGLSHTDVAKLSLDLLRRVERIEEILRAAAVTRTRDV